LTPALHTWTGANGFSWADSGNWIGGSPAGDSQATLEFPLAFGAKSLLSVDNIPGKLFIQNMIFDGSGYHLELDTLNTNPAPSVTLDFDIVANNTSGTNSLVGMPLGLAQGVGFTHFFTAANGGTLILDSLSDAEGSNNITTSGAGVVQLLGTNSTYVGSTNVNAGTLIVANTGIPPTTVVNVANGAQFALASDITIGALSGPAGSRVALDVSTLHVQGGSFSGVISGTASSNLSMDGTGTFTLAGANTYSGGTHVNSGTLRVGGGFNTIPSASAVTVNAGARFDLNGFLVTMGSLAGAGSVTLGNQGLTVGVLHTGSNGSSTTFSGVISGPGSVVKEGSGTFTLANNNTYSGGTLIAGGTLRLAVNNAVPAAGIVTINSGTLDLNGKDDTIGSLRGAGAVTLGNGTLFTGVNNTSTTYSGIISGSGNLVKTGTGTFTLAGANTYSGRTNIAEGVLRLGVNNAIPPTSSAVLGFIFARVPATLDLNNFNDTIGSLTEIPSLNHFVTLGQGTLTTGADGSSRTFRGVISGSGGLTKIGAGTFVLAGNNTYTGATTVQAGTLEVDGSCGNVIVNGGTLRGVGSVASIDALSGATVSPGVTAFPGTLHCTNFANFASGSALQVRLNSKTAFDQLNVGGLVVLNGTPTLSVTVNYPAQVGPPPDTFTIISAGVGVTGTFNGLPNVNPPATFTANGQRFQIQYFPTSVVLTRVAGPVTHFQIDTPSTTQAGAPFDYTLTALDDGNRIVSLFTGTVRFSSQDPLGTRLPDDYTFTIGEGGDNGVHIFSGGATLFTAGSWDVTATVLNTGATSSATVTVSPAPAVSFAILTPPTATAGKGFDLTLAAQDPYGNIDTNYRGTVRFATSDAPGSTLPAAYTFPAADNGVHTFAAGAALITAGSQTILTSDAASGFNGSAAVVVTPAPADHFVLSAPAQVSAGVPFDLTITALDPYGNTDTNYQGTVHFNTSDSDPGVVLPAGYTFQPGDGGVYASAGSVTLVTPGDQTITATDPESGITGSASVSVSGGATAPPGRRGGGSGAPGPLVAAGVSGVSASATGGAGAGKIGQLDAGIVDGFFASTQQDTPSRADR
jgi:autotransporter-associated beta strand protein